MLQTELKARRRNYITANESDEDSHLKIDTDFKDVEQRTDWPHDGVMECVTLYDWWKLKSIKTSRTKWLAELARGKPLPPNTEFFRVKLWVLKETYKKFRKVSRVFICKSILIIEIKERKNTLKKQTKPREKVCLEPYETMQSYDIQTNLETGLCVWKATDTRAVILSGWENK